MGNKEHSLGQSELVVTNVTTVIWIIINTSETQKERMSLIMIKKNYKGRCERKQLTKGFIYD